MRNEEMTVNQAYKELKGDIQDMATKHDLAYKELKDDIQGMATKADLNELRDEFKADMSKMRTWVISLFIGAVVIMGTLVGAYANMTIALLR